jgi:hypothetical protein
MPVGVARRRTVPWRADDMSRVVARGSGMMQVAARARDTPRARAPTSRWPWRPRVACAQEAHTRCGAAWIWCTASASARPVTLSARIRSARGSSCWRGLTVRAIAERGGRRRVLGLDASIAPRVPDAVRRANGEGICRLACNRVQVGADARPAGSEDASAFVTH